MERPDRGRDTTLLKNQPYDESLEVIDSEEVASVYSPPPHRPRQPESQRSRKGRGLMAANSGSDEFDEDHNEPPGRSGVGPHEEDDEDEEEEEEEDSDEEDSDDDDEPSKAPEGAYDPADYANLPVSTEVKELFQYITRYSPQSIELEHSLKPFIPDFIPAVGDIDAFLKVPRPDGKADNLGLLVLDEPSVKQSDPTVMSLWLSEESKQHGATETSSSSPAVCREFVYVVDLQRYSRDQGSSVYFPQAVLSGDDLYDVTLTDGDCRLRVTLDPGLNRLVERNVLQPGSVLRNASFTSAMAAQLPACRRASGQTDSYRLLRAEVADGDEDDAVGGLEVDSLPWFGSSEPAGALLPLRANRSLFLPLWNTVDYSGQVWREAPPTEEEDEEEDEEAGRHASHVSVTQLRESFLSGRRGVAKGVIHHQLIVRIINKSHLMYYGRTDRNCECPYKAVLEVCDRTGSVCVVLWNSMCVRWYRSLKPGDIISLRHYRVKHHYQAEPDDIEISVNSRNPAAHICVLPESSVSPECLPPAPTYSFCTSQEILDCCQGVVCDVIGLLTFTGRPERIRSKGGGRHDGKGAELLEYRWLRLEDGTSCQPIMVKLFSTSQPESHCKLHPLSVVVCTRLKLVRAADRMGVGFYLTNTTYTQVYCTGLGHHSEMSYRKLRPVRHFLQWLRGQDDGRVLSRALIGGFFIHPPPPVSLEMFMKDRRGEPGFLQGAELHRELDRLCYRERRTFCIQASVAMVTYSHRGEEDRCLFWTHRASSLSSSSPTSSSPLLFKSSPHPSPSSSLSSSPSLLLPLPSTPRSSRPPLSSSPSLSPTSPSSAVSQLTPRPRDQRVGKSWKRKQLLQADTPKRRRPSFTLQPDETSRTVVLFEASMEFLENANADEDDDDDDAASFVTAPLSPAFQPVAVETLPMRYNHAHREEQAGAVAMGGRASAYGKFDSAFEDYYTLRLRALSDAVMVDVVFLPHSSSSPPVLQHSNTWTSILSHGAFSSHTPPPSPADLIGMAAQLSNQRLVCVLEACHLGGATTEVILSRAFPLSD
uniref:RPA-related protein RADX-like isoform X2 n=1 Tax=Scatophagus argus TaxID=75038 RepID=UPI001ED7EAD6|nr:RPA-related protein RADX-like isoform X2 [Scatophagus argus]